MAKLAQTELPKMQRGTRATLDPAALREAVTDIRDSFDFAPHAFTDGKTYPEYKLAVQALHPYKREVASALGIAENMIRQRVWNSDGDNDREKKGKWVFALSQRSTPPKPRAPRATAEQNGS